ncbi:TPA: hypothetical protein ACY4SI_002916 [Clostridium perfringens]
MKLYNSKEVLNIIPREVVGLIWDYFINKNIPNGEILIIKISKFKDDYLHLVDYKSLNNSKFLGKFYIKIFSYIEVELAILNNNDSKIMILKDEL